MGLYERDYTRDEPQGIFLGGPRSMVVNLILINIGIFLVDYLFLDRQLAEFGALRPGLFFEHWQVYQLLTYGFIHGGPWHIGLNMLALWFFGSDIEAIYGKKQFLWAYLTLVILAGIGTVLVDQFVIPGEGAPVIGASGAVVGILVIFACYYPRRLIYIWGILPVPAWLLGLIYVFSDLAALNELIRGGASVAGRTAFETHLSGALFGLIMYRTRWNLSYLVPGRFSWKKLNPLRSRPKLRVHQPEPDERSLGDRVDEILAKISREGEASLTREERRILEDASRRYQQRKR